MLDHLMSAADRAFQAEVRAFLAEKLPAESRRRTRRATSVFHDPAITLPWQATLHARGWAAPDWPREHGGPGWNDMQRYVFASECAAARAPSLAPMGLKMVAPVIMHYGSAEQKADLLPRILSGADYWCQGYSEPGAGSDLASLQLRAAVDGDDYVLNGSKIWTTHAHFANRMFCLVRTSNEGRPQTGITFLLLDMDSPGVTVAPILTLAGEHEFNQVFFDDVRVPRVQRLGEENDGWSVAKHLLTFERGGRYAPGLQAQLADLRDAAHAVGWRDEARIARQQAAVDGLQAIELAGLDEPAPTLPSMLKILGTEAMQRIDRLALDIAAEAATDEALPDILDVAMPRYLNNRAATIFGGTNEIQRNILARMTIDGDIRSGYSRFIEGDLAIFGDALDRALARQDPDSDSLWMSIVGPLGLDIIGISPARDGPGRSSAEALIVANALGRAGMTMPWGPHWVATCLDDDAVPSGDMPRAIDTAAALRFAKDEPARLWGRSALAIVEAAEMTGLCETMCGDAIAYARTRSQFGTPIGDFQVIRHRLVDMQLALEKASAMTRIAAHALDGPSPSLARAAGTARRLVSEAAWIVGEGAVQVHGAMGLTNELRLGRFFRRASFLASQTPGLAGAEPR